MMDKFKEYNRHPTHKAMFHALAVSLSVDEDDMDKLAKPTILKKRRRDDHDKDPSVDPDKDSKKKKRKDHDVSSSKKTKDQPTSSKGTTLSKSSKTDKTMQVEEIVEDLDQEAVIDEEPVFDDVVNVDDRSEDNTAPRQEQDWFPDLEKTAKALEEFDDLLGTAFDFSNFVKHYVKKDKLTKVDLEGPIFELLKGTCRSSIELEYHLEQHYFFNKDLEYLRSGNLEERKYTASFTKAKATRIYVEKEYGYGYLKEIVVKRANQKEYRFEEADFPRLHLNNIEDMFLMYYQNKLHHLDGNIQTKLAVALRFFIRRIVLKHRVKDVQCLMRGDKVYKFGDTTIMKVHDELKYRMNNFRIGYNKDMPTRPWSEKDRRRT
ncbi:hypothetical protein Tco_0194000 [Tanacetum coccineum]